MKKILAFLIAMLIILTACSLDEHENNGDAQIGQSGAQTESPVPSDDEEITEPAEDFDPYEENAKYLAEQIVSVISLNNIEGFPTKQNMENFLIRLGTSSYSKSSNFDKRTPYKNIIYRSDEGIWHFPEVKCSEILFEVFGSNEFDFSSFEDNFTYDSKKKEYTSGLEFGTSGSYSAKDYRVEYEVKGEVCVFFTLTHNIGFSGEPGWGFIGEGKIVFEDKEDENGDWYLRYKSFEIVSEHKAEYDTKGRFSFDINEYKNSELWFDKEEGFIRTPDTTDEEGNRVEFKQRTVYIYLPEGFEGVYPSEKMMHRSYRISKEDKIVLDSFSLLSTGSRSVMDFYRNNPNPDEAFSGIWESENHTLYYCVRRFAVEEPYSKEKSATKYKYTFNIDLKMTESETLRFNYYCYLNEEINSFEALPENVKIELYTLIDNMSLTPAEKANAEEPEVIENARFVRALPFTKEYSGPVSAFLVDERDNLYLYDGEKNETALIIKNVADFEAAWGAEDMTAFVLCKDGNLYCYNKATGETEFVANRIRAISPWEGSMAYLKKDGTAKSINVLKIRTGIDDDYVANIVVPKGAVDVYDGAVKLYDGRVMIYNGGNDWRSVKPNSKKAIYEWECAAITDENSTLWYYPNYGGAPVKIADEVKDFYVETRDKINYSNSVFYLDGKGDFYVVNYDGRSGNYEGKEKLASGVNEITVSGRYYALKMKNGTAKIGYQYYSEPIEEFDFGVSNVELFGTNYAVTDSKGFIHLGKTPSSQLTGGGETMSLVDEHVAEVIITHPKNGKTPPEGDINFRILEKAPEGYWQENFGDFTLWFNRKTLESCVRLENVEKTGKKIIATYLGEERVIAEVLSVKPIEEDTELMEIENSLYGKYEYQEVHYFNGYFCRNFYVIEDDRDGDIHKYLYYIELGDKIVEIVLYPYDKYASFEEQKEDMEELLITLIGNERREKKDEELSETLCRYYGMPELPITDISSEKILVKMNLLGESFTFTDKAEVEAIKEVCREITLERKSQPVSSFENLEIWEEIYFYKNIDDEEPAFGIMILENEFMYIKTNDAESEAHFAVNWKNKNPNAETSVALKFSKLVAKFSQP